MANARDPLEPAATVVNTMVAMVATLMGLGIVATIFGSGSLFGIGSPYVCVDARSGIVGVPQMGGDVLGMLDNVTSSIQTVELCTNSPTVGQRVLNILIQLPTFLVFIGGSVLAISSFRRIRRDGIFAMHTADRLRALGWFVFAGEVLATLIEAIARGWLADTMINGSVPMLSWSGDWKLSWAALILGVVLISFARIMKISAAMREELDGTI